MLSQKSLRLSCFFIYSFPWQWLTSSCLPARLCVLLSQLLRYWFLLMCFSFQLLCNSSLLFLFFSRSLLNISCMFSISASILLFFWDIESSSLSFLWILFLVHCLSLLHLLVLGFYLVPSSATSICLTFSNSGFHFTGHRIVAFLASTVCPLWWMRLSKRFAGFLVGKSESCFLVGEAGLWPFGDQGLARRLQAPCLLMGGPVLPLYWCCLTWGIPALESTGCWVGLVLGRNGSLSGWSPQKRVLTRASTAGESVTTVWHSHPCLHRRPSKAGR